MKVVKKKKRYTLIFATLSVAIFVFISSALAVNYWYQQQLKPVSTADSLKNLTIEKGETSKSVAAKLEELGLIRSSQAFQWHLRVNKLVSKIQSGSYELNSSQSAVEIADMITSGEVVEQSFTILPGKRLDQIKKYFIDKGFDENEVNQALDPANYQNHPALISKPSGANLEGYLFPETFRITSATPAKEVVSLSLDQLSEVLTPELINIYAKNGLNIHEALTLASIVEKEAGSVKEKPTIAGVFYNRLKIGMKLQSDPTYQYGAYLLGVPPTNRLDSPYNTYVINGLPPGPISNVSKAALEAVAYPQSHDYLYFVAGDDNVTRFSKTVEEHEALVKQYCIKKCSTF